jgi:hypothetical protein
MGTIVLQEIYHIFMLILCSQIFIGIFLWSSSASYNSVAAVWTETFVAAVYSEAYGSCV